jgi:hypothetical protein
VCTLKELPLAFERIRSFGSIAANRALKRCNLAQKICNLQADSKSLSGMQKMLLSESNLSFILVNSGRKGSCFRCSLLLLFR